MTHVGIVIGMAWKLAVIVIAWFVIGVALDAGDLGYNHYLYNLLFVLVAIIVLVEGCYKLYKAGPPKVSSG